MRVFLSVTFNNKVKDCLKLVSSRFNGILKGTQPSKEQLHLTLFFWGEINYDKVKKIIEIVDMIEYNNFLTHFVRVGYFQKNGIPTLIFAEIDSDLIKDLQCTFKDLFLKNGVDIEVKSFVPHITLFRIKELLTDIGSFKSALLDASETLLNYREDICIDRVILYESILSSSGPKYTALHEKIFT